MKLEGRIWRLGSLFTLLLLLLSTRIVYWQLLRGEELRPVAIDTLSYAQRDPDALSKGDRITEEALKFLIGETQDGEPSELPQPVVQRTRELLHNITRGTIYDRNGEVLAEDVVDDQGYRRRVYSEPSLGHVIGYLSGLRTGIAGLEMTYNESLLGLDRPLAQLEQMIHQPIHGSDVHLTIDRRIQQAADQALGGRPGTIVVLDGHSGAVLAMVSKPDFDPNQVQDPGYLSELVSNCNGNPDCQGIFINRATQGLYVPGSTFKTVTLIAALDTGLVDTNTVFDFGEQVVGPNGRYYIYEVDGGIIPDPNHAESKLSLEMSYAKSANAAFARMADEMGGESFVTYSQRLGFSDPELDRRFPLEIPHNPSQLANNVEDLYDNNLLRAATGIGQGELAVTPLQMGMVVLPVLNGGDLPAPYFVEQIDSPTGFDFGGRVKGRVVRNTMSEKTAETVKQMMIFDVEQGYGLQAGVPGLTVGGKTGTAQLGGEASPHSWFIGFAEDGDRAVVMAVLVENAGHGSEVSAPIFAQVAQAAFQPTNP
jgi:peptidoglycan glycosyltransferase